MQKPNVTNALIIILVLTLTVSVYFNFKSNESEIVKNSTIEVLQNEIKANDFVNNSDMLTIDMELARLFGKEDKVQACILQCSDTLQSEVRSDIRQIQEMDTRERDMEKGLKY